ncbi:MAG: hypothetical protein ACKOWG_14330 [Planctomycetia bacterium]
MHCDPGPNVVRAYHVKPAGAGYAATAETIIDGSADRWFRPSDVCVAPDGSLIVADWHDPGVGGHGMGDIEKGRLYRIAPKGSAWSVPAARFGTVADCLAALASPNLCTRALALDGLAKQPQEAATALAAAFASATDAVVKARFAWAAGMLPGQAEAWIARLAGDADERFRIIALRMCRLTKGDVLVLVEKLLADPAAAVRRECAIALKGKAGQRADRAWAELAAQHKAGDRWELEALGVGADGLWDGRLEAWLAKTSAPTNAVGREIVWRSRGGKSSELIGLLLGSPDVGTSESLALLRSFDFQEQRRESGVVHDLLAGGLTGVADEKLRVILPELVLRLAPGEAADPVLAKRIDEAAGYVAGTQRFVELVQRFGLKDRFGDLVTLATDPGTAEQLAAAAAGGLMDGGGEERV